MKEIQIFKHEMFGEIRTMTNEKGETWFVGKDVAEALGIATLARQFLTMWIRKTERMG